MDGFQVYPLGTRQGPGLATPLADAVAKVVERTHGSVSYNTRETSRRIAPLSSSARPCHLASFSDLMREAVGDTT